jgi:DNA-binding LytR/AlgR family response regulator
MTCLIVDDNPIARATLRQLTTQVRDLSVAGEFADGTEALQYLAKHPVDLLLLDIEMPGMNGLELTRRLGANQPVIIFTTSRKQYAVEAFELNVADYLLKPVAPARFVQAVDKARDILDSRKEEVQVDKGSVLFIRDSNIVRRLDMDEILYAGAMGDYVKLHTPQRFYAIHNTLKAVEERLPPSRFVRVHRSYIVALDKIDTIQDGALVIQGRPVPVADAYRASLNRRMNIL